MRLILAVTGLAALLPAPPTAAATVAPNVFEAMSEGRTLYFSRNGEDFGAEQYFPGRRALWRYIDGSCAWGRWYESDGLICFEYENADGPQCWDFQGDGTSFSAALVENGAPTGLLLHLSGMDQRPLDCPGPGVGS